MKNRNELKQIRQTNLKAYCVHKPIKPYQNLHKALCPVIIQWPGLEEEMKTVRKMLLELVRIHSEYCTGDKFNTVNFCDEDRQEAWKSASENPEELVKVACISVVL